MIVRIPLKLSGGPNTREHWSKKAKRTKTERTAVDLVFKSRDAKESLAMAKDSNPDGRWVVTLTRVAPRKCDDDNLAGRFKAVRDQVAKTLGIDDGKSERLKFEYAQHKGQPNDYAVTVEIISLKWWESNEQIKALLKATSILMEKAFYPGYELLPADPPIVGLLELTSGK